MASRTPDQIAADWSSRLGGSGDKIRAGVAAVTVAPGQAAARQKSAWINGVQNSQDKWARNVAAVPLSDWQASMNDKGIGRIQQGATAAQPKFAAFMGRLMPYVDAGRGQLPSRGNLAQNIDRMVKWTNYMAAFGNRAR